MSDQPPYPPPAPGEFGPPGSYPPPPPPPPGSYPPPPPGSYPPPPSGSYPPPPPGSYPPPPPGGSYPPPPPGSYPPPDSYGSDAYSGYPGRFDIGRAFSYAWTKYQQHAGLLIGVMAVAFVGSIIGAIVAGIIRAGFSGRGLFAFLVVSALTQIVLFVVTNFLQIGLYRSTLAVTAGRRVEFAQVFTTEGAGPYLVVSILYAVMVGVGMLLCILPGIIVAFLGFFAPYFVLDQGLAPVDAIKASFRMVNANLGQMIPFAILAFIVYAVGFIACGIGVLVTGPVALLAVAVAYRSLNGQPVAA